MNQTALLQQYHTDANLDARIALYWRLSTVASLGLRSARPVRRRAHAERILRWNVTLTDFWR